ncbi:DUF1642 domain-containing protein [Aneurinibacillus aneurinilyticus]|uniref:DUF1642 domain-containing protein n=1 Tax=Aneurinibacillus aneurinilyticus TaxID=1391 RepID=UPI00366AED36
MSEKVVIPREVAEAIEYLRGNGIYNKYILANSLESYGDTRCNIRQTVFKFAEKDFLTLANAVLNGYTVEQTPEDKVREYFERLRKEEQPSCGNCVEDRVRASVACQAVEFTLNTLGIKIEGVNA